MKRTVQTDGPDPVDVHVGQRLRERRVSLGRNQSEVARAIGLTFQQVQKYEKGANRIAASTLWRLAGTLDCTTSFFFDGLVDFEGRGDQADPIAEHDKRAVLMAARALSAIADPILRRAALRIVRDLANTDTYRIEIQAEVGSQKSEQEAAA
jgi:transcriptional regulator with XRE-family HTH domain